MMLFTRILIYGDFRIVLNFEFKCKSHPRLCVHVWVHSKLRKFRKGNVRSYLAELFRAALAQ
jgi:hypothetical protein